MICNVDHITDGLLVLLLLRAYAVWECKRIVLVSSLVVYIVNLIHSIVSTLAGLMHPKR